MNERDLVQLRNEIDQAKQALRPNSIITRIETILCLIF